MPWMVKYLKQKSCCYSTVRHHVAIYYLLLVFTRTGYHNLEPGWHNSLLYMYNTLLTTIRSGNSFCTSAKVDACIIWKESNSATHASVMKILHIHLWYILVNWFAVILTIEWHPRYRLHSSTPWAPNDVVLALTVSPMNIYRALDIPSTDVRSQAM